ncbi:hypothetical protein GF323_04060 [Candidatus Woesearchaeota archaeon]|nr:hypothetical protein [Candidatus Woesearchaeota archaeon]
MKKRGQLRLVFSILAAAIVLLVIMFSFTPFKNLKKGEETAEMVNFRTSLQTEVLQQSAKSVMSTENITLSLPSSVNRIYFFDSSKSFNPARAIEVANIFADDRENNMFLETEQGFIPYSISGIMISEENNPMGVKIIGDKITLRLITGKDGVEIDAAEDMQDIKCVSVLNNGEPGNKIDIVFLNYGFEDITEFNEQVNRYINNILLEFRPFKEHSSKFNFYRIDEADIECDIKGFIDCDQFKIKLAASDCPNDYIAVLVSRSRVKDFIRPVRSSAIGNIAKINTADKPFVLVHELGHSFGQLADEYVDEGYYSDSNFKASDYANCDSSPCPSWKHVDNASCYQGCSLNKYFRPTQNSIMRSLSSPTFGPINEMELLRRLLYYE